MQVSLAPRQRASAPSADATSPASNTVDLLNAMTRFYTFTFDGDFRSVDVDVSSSNTATSVSVRLPNPCKFALKMFPADFNCQRLA